MAKLDLIVKAQVGEAEGLLEGLINKYDGRKINLDVIADTRAAQGRIEALTASVRELKSALNSLNPGGISSGNGIGINLGDANEFKKQIKTYNDAFKHSQTLYEKYKAQKEKFESLYNKGKSVDANDSQLKAIQKQAKQAEFAMQAQYKLMTDYSKKNGDISDADLKKLETATNRAEKLYRKSVIFEGNNTDILAAESAKKAAQQTQKAKTQFIKEQAELRDAITKSQTAITGKNTVIDDFIDKKSDVTNNKLTNLVNRYRTYKDTFSKLKTEFAGLEGKLKAGTATDAEFTRAKNIQGSLKSLMTDINKVQTEMRSVTKPIDSALNKTQAFDKIGSRLTDYYNRYETQLTKNIGLYNKWLTLTQRANGGQFASIAEANREFATFRTEARQAGVEIETFGSKLEKTFGTRMRSALAGYGVMAGEMAIRDILRNTIEVDTAMTELKKVTDETDKGYADFLNNAQERAQKLGATLTETVSATADFARLGYSVSEASNLADVAIMYSNIGDGIQDIDQASSSVISTMQGFGLQSENAIDIVDKFNEVGNRFATTSADVGEGMRRSSAAMAAAGNDIDQSIALFTAAQEVTQDADVVGTAMKTISMRLRSTKSDMESAGIETEGMSENVSTLRDEVLALSGVDIQLSADEYKDTFTILQEMSKVWGNLSDMTRANILEKFFGKRQT